MAEAFRRIENFFCVEKWCQGVSDKNGIFWPSYAFVGTTFFDVIFHETVVIKGFKCVFKRVSMPQYMPQI
jgi:hypothetical protein